MDMFDKILVDKYGKSRNPNNPAIQLTAPIDIYDMAQTIERQDDEIERLKRRLAEIEAADYLEMHHGIQDRG